MRTIDVQVHSEELASIPPELAAERLLSLEVPTYPPGYTGRREFISRQESQQHQDSQYSRFIVGHQQQHQQQQ